MSFPSARERPNFVPNPVSASAIAERVRLSWTASTFSAIPVMVSNNVWNSVVTVAAVMTSSREMRCAEGLSGEEKARYLLPKIVDALTSARTLAGMVCRNREPTSAVSRAWAVPPSWLTWMSLTRPMATPL